MQALPAPQAVAPAGAPPFAHPGAQGAVYHAPRAQGIRRVAKALKPDALMWALALMQFTFIWRIQDAFPPLAKVKISLLSEILVVVLFAMDSHPLRKLREVQHQPIVRMMVCLLILMVLGLPMSLWRGKTFDFLAFDMVPTFIMMFVLGTSIRGFKDIEFFAMVNVLGMLMYSALTNLFMNVGSRSGRLNNLVYYDANDISLLIVSTLPLVVYFARPKATSTQKMIALASLGSNILCFLKAGSRGGFIGLCVVGVFILLQYRAVPARLRLGAILIAATLIMTKGSEKFWENMRSLLNPKADYNWKGNDNDGRMEIWGRGMGYMWSHPLLGVGARAFSQAEGMLSTFGRANTELGAEGFKWSAAHNSFVEIGAETGVIGLGLFVSCLLTGVVSMSRVRRNYPKHRRIHMKEVAFGQALQGALLGYIVCGFFLSGAYMAWLYALYGMVIGMNRVARAPNEEEDGPAPPAAPQRPRFSGAMPAASALPRPVTG